MKCQTQSNLKVEWKKVQVLNIYVYGSSHGVMDSIADFESGDPGSKLYQAQILFSSPLQTFLDEAGTL